MLNDLKKQLEEYSDDEFEEIKKKVTAKIHFYTNLSKSDALYMSFAHKCNKNLKLCGLSTYSHLNHLLRGLQESNRSKLIYLCIYVTIHPEEFLSC